MGDARECGPLSEVCAWRLPPPLACSHDSLVKPSSCASDRVIQRTKLEPRRASAGVTGRASCGGTSCHRVTYTTTIYESTRNAISRFVSFRLEKLIESTQLFRLVAHFVRTGIDLIITNQQVALMRFFCEVLDILGPFDSASISRGKRAGKPSESRRSLPLMDALIPKGMRRQPLRRD
ncbi:hypothetical protein EVAR_25595_1 [Eumeta japonica]|uniref:Uncharacterized protein n=1 Tax=Eumeta variegata TaxID=151549 RepID=A0A4C1V0S1_EUMVA|nr:hypothetical protein EVAR_25595_1 [Eumeta japonica]